MTDEKPTNEDDDIARLFRENDDFGSDSSLWLRPVRQLLRLGKPIGQITVLAFRGTNTGSYPFGALTHTEKQRVVFWPVLPRNADMIAAKGKAGVTDHITLELANKKTHVTAYTATGKPLRTSAADLGHEQAWRLHDIADSGLALWFTMLVRWSVLLDQETAVQRRVKVPTPAEAERRTRVFRQIAAKINVIDMPLPARTTDPEYVCCSVYFITGNDGECELSSDIISFGHLETEVEGWLSDTAIETRPYKLKYEHTKFIFASACPPGTMRQDVTFGLPRLASKGKAGVQPMSESDDIIVFTQDDVIRTETGIALKRNDIRVTRNLDSQLLDAADMYAELALKDEVNSKTHCMASIVIAAFAVEGCLNRLGPSFFSGWEDFETKLSPQQKLELFGSMTSARFERGAEPHQSFSLAIRFRNKVAHLKRASGVTNLKIEGDELVPEELPETDWESEANPDTAQKVCTQIRSLVSRLSKAETQPYKWVVRSADGERVSLIQKLLSLESE